MNNDPVAVVVVGVGPMHQSVNEALDETTVMRLELFPIQQRTTRAVNAARFLLKAAAAKLVHVTVPTKVPLFGEGANRGRQFSSPRRE